MITFIDEEKENGTGSDWIEINSQHSDICSIAVGTVRFDGDGNATNDYASYALIGIDIVKLQAFTQDSVRGNSLLLEWCSDDEMTSQILSVIDFGDKFRVATTSGRPGEEGKFVESYSYDVDHEVFRKAVEEMWDLYGFIQEENS